MELNHKVKRSFLTQLPRSNYPLWWNALDLNQYLQILLWLFLLNYHSIVLTYHNRTRQRSINDLLSNKHLNEYFSLITNALPLSYSSVIVPEMGFEPTSLVCFIIRDRFRKFIFVLACRE
jgi:hypothetical protein